MLNALIVSEKYFLKLFLKILFISLRYSLNFFFKGTLIDLKDLENKYSLKNFFRAINVDFLEHFSKDYQYNQCKFLIDFNFKHLEGLTEPKKIVEKLSL